MAINKDRLLFYTGTGLLIISVIEVTIVPSLLYGYLPELIIPKSFYEQLVLINYVIAFFCYAFSGSYFRRQIKIIFVLFVLFCIFQIYLQQVF